MRNYPANFLRRICRVSASNEHGLLWIFGVGVDSFWDRQGAEFIEGGACGIPGERWTGRSSTSWLGRRSKLLEHKREIVETFAVYRNRIVVVFPHKPGGGKRVFPAGCTYKA